MRDAPCRTALSSEHLPGLTYHVAHLSGRFTEIVRLVCMTGGCGRHRWVHGRFFNTQEGRSGVLVSRGGYLRGEFKFSPRSRSFPAHQNYPTEPSVTIKTTIYTTYLQQLNQLNTVSNNHSDIIEPTINSSTKHRSIK